MAGRLSPLLAKLDRWFSGAPSSDPLYLTNRTFLQKARAWLVIGCLAGIAMVAVSLSGYFDRDSTVRPAYDPKFAEAELKRLPDLDAIKVNSEKDIGLIEVEISNGPGAVLRGKVRNNTARKILSAEAIFTLADRTGSQLGAVSVHFKDLPANAIAEFRQPLQQKTAFTAIIRELHTR